MADVLAPHAPGSTDTSPLRDLIRMAVRQFGDTAATNADADLHLLMIQFANRIIDEVRPHPYWTGSRALPYLKSLDEKTLVPDVIMIYGLTALYGAQQNSAKMGFELSDYYRVLNSKLYEAWSLANLGSVNARPELKPTELSDGTQVE